jgi:hypothetical protein
MWSALGKECLLMDFADGHRWDAPRASRERLSHCSFVGSFTTLGVARLVQKGGRVRSA